jgi:hypothetical protein
VCLEIEFPHKSVQNLERLHEALGNKLHGVIGEVTASKMLAHRIMNPVLTCKIDNVHSAGGDIPMIPGER